MLSLFLNFEQIEPRVCLKLFLQTKKCNVGTLFHRLMLH